MSLAATDFDYVRRLVKNHSAIVIDPAKAYLVESRLTPLAKEHGCASLPDYLHLLQASSFGALHREAVAAMANNETWFFRDSAPFVALAEKILPALMSGLPRDHAITIWSAACSTGQEPYSIAMLLRECYEAHGGGFSILATDLCEAGLQRAVTGIYRQMEVNRGLPSALLTKYFVQRGLCWQLKPEIARMVNFRPLNLAASWPNLPRMDVIFLRNVLIYFAAETRRQILARMHAALRPEGVLFLGSAETLRDMDDAFAPLEAGNYLCYQPKQLATA